MKFGLQLAAASLALLGLSGTAFADTEVGSAQVQVVQPIQMSHNVGLNFGTIIPGPGGSTVDIRPISNSVSNSGQNLGPYARGEFGVLAESGFNYTFSVPAGNTLIGNGSHQIAVDLFVLDDGSDSRVVTGSGGFQTLYVGGILSTPGGISSGLYTGNYTATADYN